MLPTRRHRVERENRENENENETMFPQFGATAESLSKASTAVFRIGTDAHLYDDPEDVNIAPLLDSKFDSEKCEALKRLLALIAQGFDVSNFFPQVTHSLSHSLFLLLSDPLHSPPLNGYTFDLVDLDYGENFASR